MEANECDTGHLDSNVLLPPRKRLLAGLKRHSSESTSQGSPENSSSILLCGYSVRLQNLLKSYKNGTYMSPEEIAEAAGSAASAAAKVAAAARAVAQEKAAIAAKATAAAKHALSLVAYFSNETGGREGQLKKNKMKKHIPVQQLYSKQKMAENCGTDEELARKLHRAINSSPRILKGSPGSESNKHKKLKISQPEENNGFPNTIAAGNGKFASPCGGDDEEDPDSEGSYVDKGYEKASKPSKSDPVLEISGEAELDHSKEKLVESPDDMQINGRKRGRNKQKKLLLSFCSLKDRVSPKDELKQSSSDVARAIPDKTAAGDIPLSSMDPHTNTLVSIEPVPTWKCQDFKVPRCIEPNKVVQS